MGYMEGNKEDYTEMCGYYECEDCSERFMSLQIGPIIIVCSSCGEAQDMDSCQMLQLCIFYKSDTSLWYNRHMTDKEKDRRGEKWHLY